MAGQVPDCLPVQDDGQVVLRCSIPQTDQSDQLRLQANGQRHLEELDTAEKDLALLLSQCREGGYDCLVVDDLHRSQNA